MMMGKLVSFTCLVMWRVYFFFQAEDGIRDLTVTGVQTCALPISEEARSLKKTNPEMVVTPFQVIGQGFIYMRTDQPPFNDRSEERRVGKECRSRWSPYH